MTKIEINGDMAFSASYLHPERVRLQYGENLEHRLELDLPWDSVFSGWVSLGGCVCFMLPGEIILTNARLGMRLGMRLGLRPEIVVL